MGPLANDRRLAALRELVDDATDAGAELLTGGKRIGTRPATSSSRPCWPTCPTTPGSCRRSPSGRIAIVNPVDSLDTAIEQANSVPYGLAAYGFTNRADYVDRMVDGSRPATCRSTHSRHRCPRRRSVA